MAMARTDARATRGLEEALERCQAFSQLGADITFLEAPQSQEEMQHKARDGFAGWITSTWLPYLERIPTNMKQEFIDSLLDEYLNLHPMDNEGIVQVTMMRLEVEAVRP